MLDHIYDHLDEPLDIGRLAEIACLSPYHWHRIYQAMYGETVATTVRRLRLHRAAGFLANSSMPIAQIAERSGYSSLQSFSRTFRAVFGVPPAQYRSQGTHSRFRPALSGDDQMTMIREVVIRYVEPMEILSVDHVGSYMQIGKAFDALFGWLAKHNLLAGQMRMIGVYFDDPGVVEEQALRSKAGVLLPGPVMTEVAAGVGMGGAVSVTRIRGGEYAVLRHVGPYSDMRAAYDWLYGTWLVQSGREAADAPVFEEYLNSPKETAPAELVTEICLAYCAEQFENDGSPVSTIVKGVKRAMAGEYSRELSAKVFAGQCRLIELGFRQGGPAGYGLRRMLVDQHGLIKSELVRGEHKSLQTDRVILMPGPESEIRIVNLIYSWFINESLNEHEIAARLNGMRIRTHLDREWTRATLVAG